MHRAVHEANVFLNKGKTETGTGEMATLGPSGETIEDTQSFVGRHAGARIVDMDLYQVSSGVAGDPNTGRSPAMTVGIADEVVENALEPPGVDTHLRRPCVGR